MSDDESNKTKTEGDFYCKSCGNPWYQCYCNHDDLEDE